MVRLKFDSFHPFANEREVKEINIAVPFGYEVRSASKFLLSTLLEVLQKRVLKEFEDISYFSVLEVDENFDKIFILSNISTTIEEDLSYLFSSLTDEINAMNLDGKKKRSLSLYNLGLVLEYFYNALKKEIKKLSSYLLKGHAEKEEIEDFKVFENEVTNGIEDLLSYSQEEGGEEKATHSNEEILEKIGSNLNKRLEKKVKKYFTKMEEDVHSVLTFSKVNSYNSCTLSCLTPVVLFSRSLSIYIVLLKEFPHCFQDGVYKKGKEDVDDVDDIDDGFYGEEIEEELDKTKELASLLVENMYSFIYEGESGSILLHYNFEKEDVLLSLNYFPGDGWQLSLVSADGSPLDYHTYAKDISFDEEDGLILFDGKVLEEFLEENPFEEYDDEGDYDSMLDRLLNELDSVSSDDDGDD